MRGREDRPESLFSYVRLDERVPSDHPLRAIRALTDEVPAGLDERFETLHSQMGRPSIPPKTLLRETLLQAFFSVRSERMPMEQIDYDLPFRWFVELPMDACVWRPTVFTHHPPCRLRHQPAPPQAHRGDFRLDQDPGRLRQGQGPVKAQGRAVFTFAAAAYDLLRIPKLIAKAMA